MVDGDWKRLEEVNFLSYFEHLEIEGKWMEFKGL